jgi:hypothetical protein
LGIDHPADKEPDEYRHPRSTQPCGARGCRWSGYGGWGVSHPTCEASTPHEQRRRRRLCGLRGRDEATPTTPQQFHRTTQTHQRCDCDSMNDRHGKQSHSDDLRSFSGDLRSFLDEPKSHSDDLRSAKQKPPHRDPRTVRGRSIALYTLRRWRARLCEWADRAVEYRCGDGRNDVVSRDEWVACGTGERGGRRRQRLCVDLRAASSKVRG